MGQLVSLARGDCWGSSKAGAGQGGAGIISRLVYFHVWQLRMVLAGTSAEAVGHGPFVYPVHVAAWLPLRKVAGFQEQAFPTGSVEAACLLRSGPGTDTASSDSRGGDAEPTSWWEERHRIL